ncbi:MAG: sugar ABC transporter permease [Candidatus Bathyarchaeota archaeon]|jgi:multiple sugar transport system permease protein|nr:MAG: sugar ABC transporter permease [Candidatus Bathyarchaeota archaeon]
MVEIQTITSKAIGVMLVIPAIALLTLVCFFPLAQNVELSFHSWHLAIGAPKTFVGLANFERLIFSSVFHTVLLNTVTFTAISVPLELGAGLGLALLLSRKFRGRDAVLAVISLPMLVAPVAVGLVWKWFYALDYGMLNPLLGVFGVPPVNWLADPSIALLSVTVADAWTMTPFMMLFCYAGLQMIPRDRYEVAAIDGASGLQKFRYVTLPSIKGILVMGLMIRAIDAFTRLFDLVYVLTGGGPAFSTEVLPIYTFRTGLRHFRIGMGSALSILTLAITVVFVYVLWKLTRR